MKFVLNVSLLVLVSSVLTACVSNRVVDEPHSVVAKATTARSAASDSLAVPELATLYDVKIQQAATKRQLSVEQLAEALSDADVVFIGEYHGNHGSHWLQAQLQAALLAKRPKQILSMEQFSRDKQTVVDQYLKGEIGEVALRTQADAWPNYEASYRPLVEFAKQRGLPVIAANAPTSVVRCIGRQGRDYLKKLDQQERQQLASQPFLNNAAYQHAFQAVMHGPADSSAMSNSYLAQLSRDNTMAESILVAHKRYLDHQIIHVNGAFHSDNYLGTVALLKQRRPGLKIGLVSPLQLPEIEAKYEGKIPETLGDYLYLVQPLPEQYANAAEREAAFQKMFSGAAAKPCK